MDIAHVYWCIQNDTYEVFTCTADLFFFSFFFIDQFILFLLFVFLFLFSFFSLGAAIGYLMQIFSLVYISCMTKGSYCQSAFKRLSVVFVLHADKN